MTTRKDHLETEAMLYRLTQLLMAHDTSNADYRVHRDNAEALRRISMTLHRWHELECGDGNGHIERDEETGTPRYFNDRARYFAANDVRRGSVIPDRERGAEKRLAKIMSRYPELTAYVQTDPRGASLYILQAKDIPNGGDVSSYYSRGIAVYK